MPDIKKCSLCGKTKFLSSFSKKGAKLYRSFCKNCGNAKKRKTKPSPFLDDGELPATVEIESDSALDYKELYAYFQGAGAFQEEGDEACDEDLDDLDIRTILRSERNLLDPQVA